jgi:AraC-like DNA-binding protein
MLKGERNYFRYFRPQSAAAPWGLAVTAAGYTEVAPGAPYPPTRHPADHDFDWERGRTLDALQVVLISNGAGSFESRPTGRRKVTAGSAFIVLPGVWHRYRPDRRMGWTESWVELRGSAVGRLRQAGVLQAAAAVRRQTDAVGLNEALDSVHARARSAGRGFDPELAALALGVLAAWWRVGEARPVQTQTLRAIVEAERYLAAHHTEPVNVRALALRLGVAYSHFRRQFREHTGYAPWQYVLRLRLVRARRLLAVGDAPLENIAAELGFSSAFHFSCAFKQAFGLAPDHWRRGIVPRPKRSRARRATPR